MAQRDQAAALAGRLQLARRELPDTRPIARAAEAASRHAALLARAREDVGGGAQGARRGDRRAGREGPAAAAGRRRAPDAHRRRGGGRDRAGRRGVRERRDRRCTPSGATLAQAEEDLAEQHRDDRAAQAGVRATPRKRWPSGTRLQEALEEEFRALEEALQADVQRVLEEITADRASDPGAPSVPTGGWTRKPGPSTTRPPRRETSLRGARQALARRGRGSCTSRRAVRRVRPAGPAVADRGRQQHAVARLAGRRAWPDPVHASDELADRAGRGPGAERPQGGPPRPMSGAVFPARRQRRPRRLRRRDPGRAAGHRGHAEEHRGTDVHRAQGLRARPWTPATRTTGSTGSPAGSVIVHVIDDEGRKPVAEFATRIGERAADQGVLLEDRERKVLEDELLGRPGAPDPRPGHRRPRPHPRHGRRHQVQADVVGHHDRHPLGAVGQDHRPAAGRLPAAGAGRARPGTTRRAAGRAAGDDPRVPGRAPAGHLPRGAGQRARLPVLARVRAAAEVPRRAGGAADPGQALGHVRRREVRRRSTCRCSPPPTRCTPRPRSTARG